MTISAPATVALVAGMLATLNPCGMVMLAAFLSTYLGSTSAGAEERPLNRALHGTLGGLAVTAGFLAVFAALGVPIALGLGQLTAALPWAGLGLGVLFTAGAVATLLGRRVGLPGAHRPTIAGRRGVRRGLRGMVGFGAGYGLASVGCTLPLFLAALGAATTGGGPLATLAVCAAYAAGAAIVLVALSASAALLRHHLARRLTRMTSRRVSGVILLLVGLYLFDYYGAALFAPASARPDAALSSTLHTIASQAQAWAAIGAGRWLLLGAACLVAVLILGALWNWARDTSVSPDRRLAPTCSDCEPAARPADAGNPASSVGPSAGTPVRGAQTHGD